MQIIIQWFHFDYDKDLLERSDSAVEKVVTHYKEGCDGKNVEKLQK